MSGGGWQSEELPVSDSRSRERRVVHFQGHVQGVGFRYTTARIAAQFTVEGYVQNLPDGRVVLVAEGAGEELDRFLAEVEIELGRHVRQQNTVKSAATGEFSGFGIRY